MINHLYKREKYILNEMMWRATEKEGELTQFICQQSDANDNNM